MLTHASQPTLSVDGNRVLKLLKPRDLADFLQVSDILSRIGEPPGRALILYAAAFATGTRMCTNG